MVPAFVYSRDTVRLLKEEGYHSLARLALLKGAFSCMSSRYSGAVPIQISIGRDHNTKKISTNWKDDTFPGIRFAWGGGTLGWLCICIWLAF